MDRRDLAIVAAFQGTRLEGTLALTRGRVLEILNDSSTDYFTLTAVKVYQDNGQCTASLPKATVSKKHLLWLANLAEQHESPQSRLNSFQNKNHAGYMIQIADTTIRGLLHGMTGEPLVFLSRLTTTFFPVTQATVQSPQLELHPSVVFVNRHCLYVIGAEGDVGEDVRNASQGASSAISTAADLLQHAGGDPPAGSLLASLLAAESRT